MGKPKVLKIVLESGKTVYHTGDEINGVLLVQLDSPMEVREITVKFLGEAFVRWEGTAYAVEEEGEVTQDYIGKQKLFKHKVSVFKENDEPVTLPEGKHEYKFSCKLPDRLPTSYEDHIGHIRYEIKAKIDKPGDDINAKKFITVIEVLDLNTVHKAMEPASGDETKYLCCACFKSGPIKAEFQSDRSAYVPGEFVTINATLKNESGSKVKGTSTSLMQRVTYHAEQGSQTRLVHVAGLSGKECPKGEKIEWNNERFQIPPIPPTSRDSCKILEIEYFLMFHGHLRTCAVDLREMEDITIGTVPLANLDIYKDAGVEVPADQDSPAVLPNAIPDDATEQVLATPKIVPPAVAYKAAKHDGVNLAAVHDDGKVISGKKSFSPQYTFYDWSQTSYAT